MKLNKAINYAIECIQAEIKRIAVDANLYDKGIADYDMAKRRSERRKLLQEAIEELSKLENK